MKKFLQSMILLFAALMVPTVASAAFVQVADGVYQDGSTLYIGSDVTSLGALNLNPSEIYCYAERPPACVSNTFTGYGATLHVPSSAMVNYFSAPYWYNFSNISPDAVEPHSVTLNQSTVEMAMGESVTLLASISPATATPGIVAWSSTNTSVATVNDDGTVTAVGVGECYVRAICVDKQAYCHIIVTSQYVTVNITLDKHEARLLPNHTMTLTATCSPATTDLVVTSSNPGIALARYVNGTIEVTGVSEGTATITVATSDGWCIPDSCVVTVYTEVGDVNCDGDVTIRDVTSLINFLLDSKVSDINVTNADTNKDGQVNISDVASLINYLLNGFWPWDVSENETFTVNGVTFTMVLVEGDTFRMGAADNDPNASSNEKPAHDVTLSSYSIGETEVTQALWQAVMGSNPSIFTGDQNLPVENVTWNDCKTFIFKLNQLTGRQFRLPTEAEWEYAARGGKLSEGYKYAGSNTVDNVAWYSSNSESTTHVVATKAPNELGLYDMSGNVWEWCQDWYGRYSDSSQTDPTGPATGSYRVLRGGSWDAYGSDCRVSRRTTSPSGTSFGLRLAL